MMLAQDEDYMVHKYLHGQLATLNAKVASNLDGNCIFINSPMLAPLDKVLYRALSELTVPENKHLIIVLQTLGGSLVLVEKLVDIIRYQYDKVSFIVPDYSMSVGTALLTSGNEIYMNVKSVAGLVNPQITVADGGSSPGLGKLFEKKKLKDAIIDPENPHESIDSQHRFRTYNPYELFQIRQSIELGESLITKWLSTHKFANWFVTRTRGIEVTEDMRIQRAKKVAKSLVNPYGHYTNNRGISMKRLEEEFDLQVIDYGTPELSELDQCVTDYHDAVVFFLTLLNTTSFVHTNQKLWRIQTTSENTKKQAGTADKESEEERKRKKEQEIEQWELIARMSKHIPIPKSEPWPSPYERKQNFRFDR